MTSANLQASSANNILLLHLGAVDTLLGILFLAFSAPGLTKDNWLSIGAPCAFHGFLFTLLHPLLLWTVCGLNCDRYYAIASPLHYGHLVSPRKILVGLGAGWTVSLALCMPPLFTIAPYRYSPGLGACAPDFSNGTGALWYSALYTALTLLLPATLIVCCNLKILMIARYHRHRIASAIYEVTLSAQVTITHQRNPFFVPTVTAPSAGGPKFRGRSAIYSVLQLLGSFMLLYLPYYGVIMWESSTNTLLIKEPKAKLHPHFVSIVSTLLTCSPSVNGFLYGVKSKTVRKTFQNYWRKKLSKNEVNQEIQARTPSTCGSRRQSLTPLGFLSKPTLQRRLSEALLDVQKAVGSPQKPKIKRIASEIAWRPRSTTALNVSPSQTRKMPQTASCNTLQVPKQDEEVSIIGEDDIQIGLKQKLENNSTGIKANMSTTNLLLQKFFGFDDHSNKKAAVIQTVLEGTPKRSPRILITRAFSEESDKTHSNPSTPAKEINKKHSSSATTLLERKWRQLRYKDEIVDADAQKAKWPTTKPLLQNSSGSNKSSDSSDASEASSGRLFMSVDKTTETEIDTNATEDQLLLSWPSPKKYINKNEEARRSVKQTNLVKQTMIQSQEVVL
ncbi:hypothetical protein Trydic_g3378 [Trypoxylus dichotomus]